MNIHDIIKFGAHYNSISENQIKSDDKKINAFIETYKAYSDKLTTEQKADFLFLLTLLCKTKSVLNLLQETNKDVLESLNKKIQQYEENFKSTSNQANHLLPKEVIQANAKANSYGFNREVYEEILPLTQLAYLFEKNGNPVEHAYKLTVMFGNKKEALKYLQDASPKNLHDACLFSLPSSPPNWNIEAWRTLATKQSTLAKNQKFQVLLSEAGRIEQKILSIEWLSQHKQFIEEKIKQEKNVEARWSIELKGIDELLKLKEGYAALSSKKEKETLTDQEQKKLEFFSSQLPKKETLFLGSASVEILNAVYATLLYEGADKAPEAAVLFKKYGISQKEFNLYLTLPKTGGTNIPPVTIKGEEISQDYKGYYLKKLDPSDPRAAILGKMTGCCQSLGGAGQACVIHGITSPDGGFYVLCKGNADNPKPDDEMVAQAWAWRSQTGALVLDSIESPLSLKEKSELISDFFTLLAHRLVTENNIPKVMVGGGGNTPLTIGWSGIAQDGKKELFKDYSDYSDSLMAQRTVAIKDNPLYYYARIKLNEKAPTNEFWKKTIKDNLKGKGIGQLKDWIGSCVLFKKRAVVIQDTLSNLPIEMQNPFKEQFEISKEMYTTCETTPLVVKKIIELANKGANLDIPVDGAENTVFMKICASNNREVASVLLKNGADINATNKRGETALMLTAKMGHLEMVKWLVQQLGIDVNAKDNDGNTALMLAAENDDSQVVKLLVQKPEIDVNLKNKYSFTALMWAAGGGELEIVKLLVQKPEIDVNAKNQTGNTALKRAVKKCHFEIVKILIQQPGIDVNGIDVNAKNEYDNTLLTWATARGDLEMVKWLLQQPGINVNIKNTYGASPVMLAAKKGNFEIVRLLVQQPGIDVSGIDLNAKDKDGETLLIWAAIMDKLEVVELLIKQPGIDLNARSKSGNTALMWAAGEGELEIVKLLIQSGQQQGIEGAVLNAQDDNGYTALIWAATTDHLEIVEWLAKRPGINLNMKNNEGNTALLAAIEAGNLEIVKWLIQHPGIDLNARNNDGNNALMLAKQKFGGEEIVTLLNNAIQSQEKNLTSQFNKLSSKLSEVPEGQEKVNSSKNKFSPDKK